ncbi:MAG: hypothetical protein RLZ22_538 [Verrucomicrobiota bacterium]|jgi:hypothetical protein
MNNMYQTFTETRLQFDAQRREQIEHARQALELKIAQRDFIKAAGEIKTVLVKLGGAQATPAPPKAASAAPVAKTKPVSKPTPKRRATPLALALDDLDKRLAAVSQRVAALASRTK